MLLNPKSLDYENQVSDVQGAARAIGQQIVILNASSERDYQASQRATDEAGRCNQRATQRNTASARRPSRGRSAFQYLQKVLVRNGQAVPRKEDLRGE